MRRTGPPPGRTSRALAVLVATVLVPDSSGRAQSRPEAPPGPVTVESRLEGARVHMGRLEYEQAIALLEPVLDATHPAPEVLGESYLLLVEAHVYRGNLSPADTKERQLWYEEARNLVRECLGTSELRHVEPDPPERYPAEMVQLFAEIRREVFGVLEIGTLEPPDAEVILGGEPLERDVDGVLRRMDIPVGTHVLLIRRPGYREIEENVDIAPATVAIRSFSLERDRGFGWYATRVIAPVAAIGTAVVIVLRGAQSEPDLPGPPPPPALGE